MLSDIQGLFVNSNQDLQSQIRKNNEQDKLSQSKAVKTLTVIFKEVTYSHMGLTDRN